MATLGLLEALGRLGGSAMALTDLCKRGLGLGVDLGISAERVRQLEQQALDTLRAAATQAPTSS